MSTLSNCRLNLKSKSLLPLVGLSIFIFSCKNHPSTEQNEPKETRPNIIVILADDMGYSDLGSYGSEIHTPALDNLAENGLRMTQFYNASRCCPSRASLLTGLYPHQANMGFMQEDCKLPNYGGYLPNNAITMAQLLKENGYNTAMSGKWHVGNNKEYWPTRKGFDKFYGFPHHGGAYFYPFAGDQILVNGETEITPESNYYSTDAINDNAVRFVTEMNSENKPFFLYLAHVAPHFPLQAKEEDIAKYRGTYKRKFSELRLERYNKMKGIGILSAKYKLSPLDAKVPNWDNLSAAEKDDFDLRMSVYAAQIDCMDQGIGRLVDKLKELNQLENTLIVFLSDNGGTREDYSNSKPNTAIGEVGSYECYKLPWANVSNTPFRMFKHWGHEGGIRTPLIVHYPKLIKSPRIDNQPAHIMDIMATVVDISKADYPSSFNDNDLTVLEGKSLLPIFNEKERIAHQELFWEHEGNKAGRIGDWKWVNAYPDRIDELYDLSNDPTEINNLANTNPDQLKIMKTQWQVWADRVGVKSWEEVLEAEPDQARLQIHY